ncbi:20521_t:CDS:2, partial [Racocetra persica]
WRKRRKKKEMKVETGKVEGASEEAIKVDKYDFRNFDFFQIRKEVMAIDPEKYPEEKFRRLLEEYNEKKISVRDLNSKLMEKKLMERLSQEKKEKFVDELIEYFLKLNEDIPDWSLRKEERRKARMEIAEKSKRSWGEKMA